MTSNTLNNKEGERASSPLQDDVQKAFDKILRCLSAREQSSARMRNKLKLAGFEPPVIEAAIAKAQALAIIDDRRYAECLIRSTLACGKDIQLILKEIAELDVHLEELEAYQEYCTLTDEDILERAVNYLMRHFPRSKNPYPACMRKLISRGYSISVSQRATKIVLNSQVLT